MLHYKIAHINVGWALLAKVHRPPELYRDKTGVVWRPVSVQILNVIFNRVISFFISEHEKNLTQMSQNNVTDCQVRKLNA